MTFSNLTRVILLSVLAIILVWLVMTRSFVAHFAKLSPETALSLRSNDAEALVNLADKSLSRGNSAQILDKNIDLANIRNWTRQALQDNPLNARAFRILGQLSEKENDTALAQKNMEIALTLSIRESMATYWLMQQAYQKKNFGLSLHYANILLWHRPKLTKKITPLLVAIAENKQERVKLETVLAQNPSWRWRFFAFLPRAITDARTPLNIFLSLKKTKAPPTAYELKAYFNFLNSKKLFNLSYYGWLQFLPPEHLAKTGFLFNGNFDMPLDNMPFNWVIGKGKGATADIVFHPDNRQKKALNIRLSRGESSLGRISQIIMLSPGSHIFQGRHKGALIGPRGLRWRITCLGKKTVRIGETKMFTGRKRNWENFKMSFTVPEQDCPAQRVNLVLDARTRSEKLASGRIWYDSLKIIPKINLQ